jgi:hypothetical protein
MMRPPISGVTFNERGEAMATIEVLVTDQGVAAVPNPAAANPGELVVWNFRPSSQTFRVVFKEFQPPNGPKEPISNQRPFTQPLSTDPGPVGSIIDPGAQRGRYIYDIEDAEGRKLNWLNHLPPNQNFGGLDVPKPPPK